MDINDRIMNFSDQNLFCIDDIQINIFMTTKWLFNEEESYPHDYQIL